MEKNELLKSSTMPELFMEHLKIEKSNRKKWAWTQMNIKRGIDLVHIFNDMRQWWPLTERQLFYRLISNNCINENHWCKFGQKENGRVKDVYGTVGTLLKWLRINEYVPWDAISDETRKLTNKVGYSSAKNFVEEEIDNLFRGYSRCVAADQPNHIEIWIEKQALLNIVEPIADKYCRRVMCCKGYNSVTFQADFYTRATEAIGKGYQPVVLYFGDWDPSGVDMIKASMDTLQNELGLYGVDYYRCGINPEHFQMIQADPVPLKPTDSRAKAFITKYGNTCYELDAFHPLELQELVENSIKKFTNLDSITCNLSTEKHELEVLNKLKVTSKEYINQQFEMLGGNNLVKTIVPKTGLPDFNIFGEMMEDMLNIVTGNVADGGLTND